MVIQNSTYRLSENVESTKTKQNHIGMYTGKSQPDQPEDKQRRRNDKPIMGGKSLFLAILYIKTERVHTEYHNKISQSSYHLQLYMLHNGGILIVGFFKKYLLQSRRTEPSSG